MIDDLMHMTKRAIAHDLKIPLAELTNLNGTASLPKYLELFARAGPKPDLPKLPLYGSSELQQCARMIALMEDCARSDKNPLQWCKNIHNLCKSYSDTQEICERIIILPGGWSTPSGGHAIHYIIEATSQSTISW